MNESRILEIERRLVQQAREIEAARQLALQAIQQYPRAWAQSQPSGGGDGKVYFAIGDGTAHIATGTWPALTCDTFASDTYDMSSGSQVLVDSGATIRLWFKDSMSTTAGKLIPCTKNTDGTYTAINESCTEVT